jgi:hypothetical protein
MLAGHQPGQQQLLDRQTHGSFLNASQSVNSSGLPKLKGLQG